MKIFSASLLFLLVIGTVLSQEYNEMSDDEVIAESQLCGQSHFNQDNCLDKVNCVYLHWDLKSLGNEIRLCLSYSEIMKYYIKSPEEYLEKRGGKNHKTISRMNFCDVIDEDTNFLKKEGNITHCEMAAL